MLHTDVLTAKFLNTLTILSVCHLMFFPYII